MPLMLYTRLALFTTETEEPSEPVPPLPTCSVPALFVTVPDNVSLPVRMSVPLPALVNPCVPAKTEPMVALADAVIVGVVPARSIVPLETVAVLLKVIPLTYTVPLTNEVAPAVLKMAAPVVPLELSHGVPETPVQLVAVVSQVAFAPPAHVPL